jgi:hypothetical protein
VSPAPAETRRPNETFTRALDNSRRGDNYTLLTVAFASVLFFAAMSGRLRSRRAEWAMLGLALGLFAMAVLLLVAYPKLI